MQKGRTQAPGRKRRPLVGAALANASPASIEARAIRREKVASLLAQHRTYREIAAAIGCGIQTVAEDREAIIAGYRERYRDEAEAMIEQETLSLDELEREAIDRWKNNGGDDRLLDSIVKLKARKHALRGLNKPIKVAPTTPDGDEPWHGLTDEQLERQIRKFTQGAE